MRRWPRADKAFRMTAPMGAAAVGARRWHEVQRCRGPGRTVCVGGPFDRKRVERRIGVRRGRHAANDDAILRPASGADARTARGCRETQVQGEARENPAGQSAGDQPEPAGVLGELPAGLAAEGIQVRTAEELMEVLQGRPALRAKPEAVMGAASNRPAVPLLIGSRSAIIDCYVFSPQHTVGGLAYSA